jgi:multiple sugar transport system permease protein
MTPGVAIGILYLLIFNGSYGALNAGLGVIGIKGPFWTTDPNWVKPGLAIMLSVWSVGASVVIFLAAIVGVPRHLYEAASMDGASAWRRFKDVTLPMISPSIFFVVIINTIAGLQTFDQVYTAFFNQSTPYGTDASLMYAIYIFNQAFMFFKMGYASALAWVLFLIIGVITIIQILASRRFVYYEGAKR